MRKRDCYNRGMTEQEFNKRRATALLAAAHVCPDNLWKVRMLYEAQSDKNEYDRLSEKDKDVADTWHEIQNSQIIPEGTLLSRGCHSGQFGPEGSMPLPDKFDKENYLTAKDIAELNAELKKLEGTQFQNPRSSSSAIDPIETKRFGPIKIEYVAGKGTRGFYVGSKGYYGNETEIVIGNKNIMTIIGARVVNGVPYFVIRVDGIPDFPD